MGGDRQFEVLLGLVAAEDAERVRARLGLAAATPVPDHLMPQRLSGVPASVLLWMLQEDDPAINEIVFNHPAADGVIRREIARGTPFGGAAGPLPFRGSYLAAKPATDVIGRLRGVTTKHEGDRAAGAVVTADWPEIAAADRAEALPGYARWALTVRIDCPAEVRAQFGSHPKFSHRLRQAGIVDGPGEYAQAWTPARNVLRVLELGPRLFPKRMVEALDVLAPLVRQELSGNVEAWAVLAQLLPTFTGTVPELVSTCGAIAHS
ncbi:hypothetical protein GCM10022247_04750 [Allokutzneria multivorans]|uniref:Uncharacterized protein n=1 Tax=Allokutzneria multivorans TaxID=1142134 RepID=A0ABP7QX77_9PSEU